MVLRRVAIAVIVLPGFVVAGCGRQTIGQPSVLTPAAAPAALRWTLAGTSDVSTLDPAQTTDSSSVAVGSLLNEGLVRMDAHLRVVPGVANYWKVSGDRLTYTFHIRTGLRFSNGDRLTSGDVAASLVRAIGPASSNGIMGTYLGEVAQANGSPDIYPVGKSEIGIRLSHPSAGFLAKLTFLGAAVIDMGILRRYGSIWTSHEAGLGPYSLTSWNHGTSIILHRNKYYRPRPPTATIAVEFAPTAASAVKAFVDHKTAVVSQLDGSTNLQSSNRGEVHLSPALALDYIMFNNRHSVVNNQYFRRALASAIDRKAMVKQVFGAAAVPEASIVPPALLPGLPTEAEDSTLAVQSLAQSGHASGSSLRTLTFVYPNSSGERKRALFLSAEWQRILDVHVKPVGLKPQSYGTAVRAGKFDLALVRWGAEYPDASDFLINQLQTGAANNLSRWSNSHFDRLVKAATIAPVNSAERRTDLLAAAQIATKYAIWIPLDSPDQVALIDSELKGLELTPLGLTGWDRLRESGSLATGY